MHLNKAFNYIYGVVKGEQAYIEDKVPQSLSHLAQQKGRRLWKAP